MTGAAGFLGSHLVERLVSDGHRVTGLDDLSSGRLANLSVARKTKGLFFHRFDVTEPELEDVLARERPEVVCHLASSRTVDALRDATVGVVGTLNLLQAAVRTDVQRVLLAVDATAIYAPATKPVSERAGLAPGTSFGATQLAAEAHVETHERRYGLPAVVLRLGALYGPRQQRGVVAQLSRAMLGGDAGTLYGDGSAVRDLVHVEDVVDAFLRCLGGKGDGRRLNIGTGVGTSMRALHSLMAESAQVPDAPGFAPPRPGETPGIVLDSGAARRALGWEAETALPDGLAQLLRR